MLSTARQSEPISPGGRMPTRAVRSPPITFWAIFTTKRMGRRTRSWTSSSNTRLASVAPPTIAKNTALMTLS